MPPFRPDHAKGYFFLLSLQHEDAFLFANHHLMFCFQGQWNCKSTQVGWAVSPKLLIPRQVSRQQRQQPLLCPMGAVDVNSFGQKLCLGPFSKKCWSYDSRFVGEFPKAPNSWILLWSLEASVNWFWYRSKKMRLAKQHSTGRNGRNVMCVFHLSQKQEILYKKHPSLVVSTHLKHISQHGSFPQGSGCFLFAFMLLPPRTFLVPIWLASNTDYLRCTEQTRIHSSGLFATVALEVSKGRLKRQGIERTYTRKLTKRSPLFPWPFSINTHPPPRLCKCLGIYSICLSSWPLTMVKLGQSPKFASCTDWLTRKFSNHNHRFWVRGWWLRTKQIRIMKMNAVHVNVCLYRTILTKGLCYHPFDSNGNPIKNSTSTADFPEFSSQLR